MKGNDAKQSKNSRKTVTINRKSHLAPLSTWVKVLIQLLHLPIWYRNQSILPQEIKPFSNRKLTDEAPRTIPSAAPSSEWRIWSPQNHHCSKEESPFSDSRTFISHGNAPANRTQRQSSAAPPQRTLSRYLRQIIRNYHTQFSAIHLQFWRSTHLPAPRTAAESCPFASNSSSLMKIPSFVMQSPSLFIQNSSILYAQFLMHNLST